jgi:hypothetical protein
VRVVNIVAHNRFYSSECLILKESHSVLYSEFISGKLYRIVYLVAPKAHKESLEFI